MNVLYKGIDISAHNGIINWNKIDKTEIQFVIIRAGFGVSTVDKQFKRNIEGAIKAGLHIGVYWFGYAGTVEQAKTEAQFCLKTIAPYKKYIDFPVFYDWEYASYDYVVKQYKITPTKALVSDMAIAFMDIIKDAGYKTGNYSNPNYLGRFFNDTVKNNYDCWLAHTKDSVGNPLYKSSYKGKYTIHQYSWVGKIKGIKGKVDTNYCYYDYVSNNIPLSPTPTDKTSKYLVDYKNEQASKVVVYDSSKHGNLFLSPHFQVKEFKSPDSNIVKIDNRLIWILEKLFDNLQCSKMIINSGYRTPSYSVKVGGGANDYHTKGMAADIKPYDKNGKVISAKIVCNKLCDYGNVFGIGYISETAIHCDTRPKSAIWFGDETNGTSLIRLGYTSFSEYFNSKTLTVNSGTWNVRSKPNVLGKVITVIKGGKKYKYTTITNGWAYIPELKGWLSSKGYSIK